MTFQSAIQFLLWWPLASIITLAAYVIAATRWRRG